MPIFYSSIQNSQQQLQGTENILKNISQTVAAAIYEICLVRNSVSQLILNFVSSATFLHPFVPEKINYSIQIVNPGRWGT